MTELANRLETAIDALEAQLQDRIEQPLRRLRTAIAFQRERGGFNESVLLEEIEKIAQRDRLDHQAMMLDAASEIDHLAERLMKYPPR